MLILTSILLVTFGVLASANEDDFCQSGERQCYDHGIDLDIPDWEKDLDEICPVLITRIKCLSDFMKKCGTNNVQRDIDFLDNVHDVLVEACDKDSKLHKELTIHLPCIAEVPRSYFNSCRPIVKEALDELTSGLNIDFEVEDMLSNEDDFSKYICIAEALQASCFVASTSVKCDENAREMVESIIDRIGYVNSNCPEIMVEEVKSSMDILQPFMEIALATEEILPKDK